MNLEEYSVWLVKNKPEILEMWEKHGDGIKRNAAKLVRETAQAKGLKA